MNLQILKLHPDATVPTYGTSGAACFDLYALEGGAVFARGSEMFRTGLAFGIPEGYVMKVYSRSGHGFKHGIRLSNSVGVVDSDYTGEVFVKLQNDSGYTYEVEPGDRIAQAMLVPVEQVTFDVVEQLQLTERGANGLGSTGK
jgi:dUTP pyrophosphatase